MSQLCDDYQRLTGSAQVLPVNTYATPRQLIRLKALMLEYGFPNLFEVLSADKSPLQCFQLWKETFDQQMLELRGQPDRVAALRQALQEMLLEYVKNPPAQGSGEAYLAGGGAHKDPITVETFQEYIANPEYATEFGWFVTSMENASGLPKVRLESERIRDYPAGPQKFRLLTPEEEKTAVVELRVYHSFLNFSRFALEDMGQ